MHDIRWIREHETEYDRALNRRPLDAESKKLFSSQNLISIDDRRRAQIRVFESFQAKRNAASKEIGQAKAKKDEAAVQKLMADVAEAKESMAQLEKEQVDAQ